MSRPRSIAQIAPITAGDREVRVELAAGQVFIHVKPEAVCSHCGHNATIFVAMDGWSPCARCYNTLQLYATGTAEKSTWAKKIDASLEALLAQGPRASVDEQLILARPFLVAEKAVQA
jgi:hypothetical protein